MKLFKRLTAEILSIPVLLLAGVQPLPAATTVMDMAYPCGLTNPAFCDMFDEPADTTLRSRSGALNPKLWNFSRFSRDGNFGQHIYNVFNPTDAQHCKTLLHNVYSPNESFFCGLEVPEPQHWMEAFNDIDNDAVVYNDGMLRQPFDFTNRVGTINFGVDAKTDGPHTWWVEAWVTDEPIPGPHEGTGSAAHPRNGIRVNLASSDCTYPKLPPAGDVDGLGYAAVETQYFLVYRNYTSNGLNNQNLNRSASDPASGCIKTAPDVTNMISIKLSTTRVEIWGSHAGTNVLKLIGSADINPPLPFSVGYVHFEHVQYNAGKEGVSRSQTYHWHDMGFDGPIHALPRSYDVPDATPPPPPNTNIGKIELGYLNVDYTLQNVDITNATGASLDLGLWSEGGQQISYQVNGKGPHTYALPTPNPNQDTAVKVAHIPVLLSELVQGPNRIQLSGNNLGFSEISLTVNVPDNPVPAPKAPFVDCTFFNLMMDTMPNMTMTPDMNTRMMQCMPGMNMTAPAKPKRLRIR